MYPGKLCRLGKYFIPLLYGIKENIYLNIYMYMIRDQIINSMTSFNELTPG